MCCRKEVAGPGLAGCGAAGFLQSWREIPGINWALFVVGTLLIYLVLLFLQVVYNYLQWGTPQGGQRKLGLFWQSSGGAGDVGPSWEKWQECSKPPAAFHGLGFQPSPALHGCWPLMMLLGAQPPRPCCLHRGAGRVSLGCDDLSDGDCTRGSIKETMKLFKLLGRRLLRSPPEPGWSPAC